MFQIHPKDDARRRSRLGSRHRLAIIHFWTFHLCSSIITHSERMIRLAFCVNFVSFCVSLPKMVGRAAEIRPTRMGAKCPHFIRRYILCRIL